jgi:hypothetical protein
MRRYLLPQEGTPKETTSQWIEQLVQTLLGTSCPEQGQLALELCFPWVQGGVGNHAFHRQVHFPWMGR